MKLIQATKAILFFVLTAACGPTYSGDDQDKELLFYNADIHSIDNGLLISLELPHEQIISISRGTYDIESIVYKEHVIEIKLRLINQMQGNKFLLEAPNEQ